MTIHARFTWLAVLASACHTGRPPPVSARSVPPPMPAPAAPQAVTAATHSIATLAYSPLGCVAQRPNPKAAQREAAVPCDSAKARRASYFAQIEATGKLPDELPDGASVRSSAGALGGSEYLRLIADGTLGSLVVEVDADGEVHGIVAGAFENPQVYGQDLAVTLKLPLSGATTEALTDLVDADMHVAARIIGYPTELRGFFHGGAAPAADFMGTLPTATATLTPPEDALAIADLSARELRAWTPSNAVREKIVTAAEGLPGSTYRVSWLGPLGVAFAYRERGFCDGGWFPNGQATMQPICDVLELPNGARFVRARKGGSDIVDVTSGAEPRVVASPPASPKDVELVKTARDQIAYLSRGRLVVQNLDGKPKSFDDRGVVPRDRPPSNDAARIDSAFLFENGTALVFVEEYLPKVFIASARGWKELRQNVGETDCTVVGVKLEPKPIAQLSCSDRTPSEITRTFAADGTFTDAPTDARAFDVARIASGGTADLTIAGERICQSNEGLLYRGKACALPVGKRAHGSKG